MGQANAFNDVVSISFLLSLTIFFIISFVDLKYNFICSERDQQETFHLKYFKYIEWTLIKVSSSLVSRLFYTNGKLT